MSDDPIQDELDRLAALPPYNAHDWFWVVQEGPLGMVWSSAASAYIDMALARNGCITAINLESELSDVLRPYGLRGPHISVDDLRTEAQRRIIALIGARDINGCLTKQLNAIMRGTELVNKRAMGGTLTPAEMAEAAALQVMADKVKAIRARSNELEVNTPANYTSDEHWLS